MYMTKNEKCGYRKVSQYCSESSCVNHPSIRTSLSARNRADAGHHWLFFRKQTMWSCAGFLFCEDQLNHAHITLLSNHFAGCYGQLAKASDFRVIRPRCKCGIILSVSVNGAHKSSHAIPNTICLWLSSNTQKNTDVKYQGICPSFYHHHLQWAIHVTVGLSRSF